MIRTSRHKGLSELLESGRSAKIGPALHARCLRLLDTLDAAAAPDDMNLPGFHFHKLRGTPERYSVRVTGNWRLTFGWRDGDATDLDLEDYH